MTAGCVQAVPANQVNGKPQRREAVFYSEQRGRESIPALVAASLVDRGIDLEKTVTERETSGREG